MYTNQNGLHRQNGAPALFLRFLRCRSIDFNTNSLNMSTPGAWRIEMHTFPSSKTKNQNSNSNRLFGCHIFDINFISGGLLGKSEGKDNSALNNPPSLKCQYRHVRILVRPGGAFDNDFPVKEIAIVFKSNRNSGGRVFR